MPPRPRIAQTHHLLAEAIDSVSADNVSGGSVLLWLGADPPIHKLCIVASCCSFSPDLAWMQPHCIHE
ncbi:uncharacterized protein PITG_15421 [Phytophthora infestans T30-4]|uniref:Uncharacterized protein n=1 Tax=Phytophthora infestans (strain T30-4) TaxID=403677 RepID=D0NR78_PHYIT|nr:uncharacterized protein PITG_15421 [Phytophthora infestans T30-4]EEY63200.1 hypothetical protein PITG_15421 [Phytophthora infestans T30-4]|eukprot:XP_002898377.1 hypothetical protein PITG_15421 [Phytophthora infestans T30-4]